MLQATIPRIVRLYDMLLRRRATICVCCPSPSGAAVSRLGMPALMPPRPMSAHVVDFETRSRARSLWRGARDDRHRRADAQAAQQPLSRRRPKGHWFKWKRDPLTLDCVLMYAQRGTGKRSSTIRTTRSGFGGRAMGERARAGRQGLFRLHRRGAVASSIASMRNHTVERFGPVREVERKLVFEVAFELRCTVERGTNRAWRCAFRASIASAGTSPRRRPTRWKF